MAATIYPTVPVAKPEAEPWPPLFDHGDEHSIRVDEMFARQLDTEFASGVRDLMHHPETGLSALKGEAALHAIAGVTPALQDLKERTLAQAIGPRQRSLLEPMIDTRLDWATGTIGQLAHRATLDVDDASVAERLASLGQDAATAWRDRAHLRKLGRTAVKELRYQGERRGWDPTETDTKARGGLSDLYAGAVEAAIGQDNLDGASSLYEHARAIIDPERQATLDRRFVRAREAAVLRDIDRDMEGIPLEPAGPPGPEVFESRAAELTPDDATDEMRARIAKVAEQAHRHAERQWNRRQAEAGVAALDWTGKNPGRSFLTIPPDVRDWLAPDQWQGLETLYFEGRLRTDGDLFERLDRQMVHAPEAFAAVDLDRHRLSLGEADYTRFAAAQKAIAEGRIDPDLARYDRLRLGIERALGTLGVDLDGPAATKVRADARDQLDSFEIIEGRPPNGEDIAGIVGEVVSRIALDDGVVQGPSPATGDTLDPRHVAPGASDIEEVVIQEASHARRDRLIDDRTTDARPSYSDREGEPVIAASSASAASADEQPASSVVDAPVIDWLMDAGSDGKPQAERPPLDVWDRLTPAQREAVDFLLARNARSPQAETLPEKQLVSDPPDTANDNTRNYVCTQAVYSCLSNAPKEPPPLWRQSCIQAESLCNRFVNQSRVNPFNRTIILNFPDHSRVIIPQGKQGGAFSPPREVPDR